MLNHDVYVGGHTRLDGGVGTANKQVNGIRNNGSTRVIVTCARVSTVGRDSRNVSYYGVAIQISQSCKANLRLLVNGDARNVYLVDLDVHFHLGKVCDSNQRTGVASTWRGRANRSAVHRVHHDDRTVTRSGDYTLVCLGNCVVVSRSCLLECNLSALQICLCRFNSRSNGRCVCFLSVLACL